MKKIVLAIFLVLLLSLAAAQAVLAVNYPDYQGYVNDLAGLMSAEGKNKLEARLAQLDMDTTAQIAVVTIKSLEGNTVEDYAVGLFEKWKIGQKGKDNGVLLLVAREDRKLRIEVGYGLEAIITDGRAGRIRDNDILPFFKKDQYEEGIVAGVNSLESLIRGGTPPAPLEENPVKQWAGGGLMIPFLVITFLGMYLTGFMARTKSVWLGAIFGVIAGAVLGLIIGGIAALVITAIVSGLFGAGFDWILSRTYKANKTAGKDTSWHRTWGGFGGGWGSGGGGGGGFGGFGGGMSGGGGASGSW
jgi:uncharacterized protein